MATKTAATATKKKTLTTVIKGSVWARGKKRPEENSLINDNGTMCCLGIDAVSRGVSRELIDGASMPSDVQDLDDLVPRPIRGWAARIGDRPSLLKVESDDGTPLNSRDLLENLAARINDNKKTTDDEKIAKLRHVFAAVVPPRKIIWKPNE